jgi:protein-disulfide isomerase
MPERLKSSLLEKFVPILVVLTVALSFIVGVLWQKVTSLEKGGVTAGTQVADTTTQAATVDIETVKGLWDKNLIKFGDKDKKVLFVEIGDPSCPYCHVAGGKDPELATEVGTQFKYVSDGGQYLPPVPEMRKLVDEGKAAYAFIYYPGHGSGEMGTKALYCAQDTGKYWEAHDLIYSNKGYDLLNNTIKNDKTKSGEMANFLKSVTDADKMKECLDSGKYDVRLADEQALAGGLAVAGTPGFFVNSTRFDGAYSFNDMKPTVEEALK